MKNEINSSFKFIYLFYIFFAPDILWAVQKAKIISPDVEIYANSDFDSEVISSVGAGETYFISDKTYGPFYRIKLKDGKIGYVVDYELDIEGKGRFKEKDLDVLLYEDAMKLKPKNDSADISDIEEEEAVFGRSYAGPTLQLISLRENVFGADQAESLAAVGYKKVADIAWSVLGSFKVPEYYIDYANKNSGTVKGLKLWADFGFSNEVVEVGRYSAIRFSGTFFTQVSFIQLKTPELKLEWPAATLGVALEVAWLVKLGRSAIDMAMKYYFDKSNYSAISLSYLF